MSAFLASVVSIAAPPQQSRDPSATALLGCAEGVLAALPSAHSRRAYAQAYASFSAFAGARRVTRGLLLRWRGGMKATLSSSTVNVRMSAMRSLVAEALRSRVLASDIAAELQRVEGLPRRGSRVGNWLTADEARKLLAAPIRNTSAGKRNYCILALLLGCALRRYELAGLDARTLQRRDGRWVLADLEGKGGRVRTVAVPEWVHAAIEEWRRDARITDGRLIRRLNGDPAGLSVDRIWKIVKTTGAKAGVGPLGPHDLRRTCAKLARKRGGALEQIQLMLGHASIETTMRYLGTEQDLARAVNDDLGL